MNELMKLTLGQLKQLCKEYEIQTAGTRKADYAQAVYDSKYVGNELSQFVHEVMRAVKMDDYTRHYMYYGGNLIKHRAFNAYIYKNKTDIYILSVLICTLPNNEI